MSLSGGDGGLGKTTLSPLSAPCQERTFAIYLNEPHSKILLPENSSLTGVMTDKTLATNIQNSVSSVYRYFAGRGERVFLTLPGEPIAAISSDGAIPSSNII